MLDGEYVLGGLSKNLLCCTILTLKFKVKKLTDISLEKETGLF